MTIIVKDSPASRKIKQRMSSIALLLTLTTIIPFPVPSLAVQLSYCEPPDGDVDGDECITQNQPKNNGHTNPDCNNDPTCTGDPINVATGNKFENDLDYLSSDSSSLILKRFYNSSDNNVSSFGAGWHGAYSQSITSTSNNSVDVMRDDGKVLTFIYNGSIWKADSDVNSKLVKLPTGWQYTTGLDEIEIYNTSGKLTSVTNRAGLTQTLSYDAQGRLISVANPFGRSLTFAYIGNFISTVTVPNGGIYTYGYDSKSNLATVTYPDNTKRTYVYENKSYPHALTGVIDENGKRYSTDVYDSAGRDISNELAGGVNKYTLSYNYLTYGYVPVKDALNVTRTSTFISVNQVALESLMTQNCPSCPAGYATTKTTTTYDANGNISSQTDFNGNTTNYTYDTTRNLQLSRTEAAGTTQARTITTAWHPTFRLPVKIVEPNQTTNFSYDTQGNLLQKTVTAGSQTKTWTMTYNTNGQLLSIDGPRNDANDVTSFTYDSKGNISTISDALGHVTTISSYNEDGQPLSLKNPNGLVTTFQYNPRGKLISSTVGTEVTRYSYDAAEQLIKITLPDASTIGYSYDDAHRLVSIADSLGNHIDYTLDKMGNRLNTQVFDPTNNLTSKRTQVFDDLSRLAKTIGTQNQTANYSYDPKGNTISIADPLNNQTTLSYDSLDRLISSIDPTGKATRSTYDSNDNPVSVTDPLAHNTTYNYDGFGNRLTTNSPDSGQNKTSYDLAGNVLTTTDALGQTVNYTYDALNRITKISYLNNKAPINFSYDQGNGGIGHLTKMTDEAGTTSWIYNAQGRIASKTFKTSSLTLTIQYGYTPDGRLFTLTYPSGKVVQVTNNNGQITALDSDGSSLLSNIHYQPFGSAKDWMFGNGVQTSRVFDLDGHLISYDLGDRSRQLTYDAAGRITGYKDSDLNYDQSFGYDQLSRITNYTDPSTQTSYSYDANGNRTQSVSGTPSKNFNIDPSSNRLLAITDANLKPLKSYTYDAAGHITGDGYNQFTYDGRGRLVQVKNSSIGVEQYRINGFGQRVAKLRVSSNGNSKNDDQEDNQNSDNESQQQASTYFIYDEAGHLLGEYDQRGKAVQETVWLNNTPVAVLVGNKRYFVYADHLNAPRAITDSVGKVVWRWDSDPFGVSSIANKDRDDQAKTKKANEDPDKDGQKFVYNLRFPGQYYDSETGLYYNGFRDYDPSTGRYIQSDPIGLTGGVNTYAYVLNNPLRYVDPKGLDIMVITGGIRDDSLNIFGHVGSAIEGYGMASYGNDTDLGSSVNAYLTSQSDVRVQQVTVIHTTPAQDAAAIAFINSSHPNKNDVGKLDNCAVRTNQVLNAAGINTNGVPFPGGTARDVQMIPGAITYTIPQDGSIPASLQNLLQKFNLQ